MCSRVRVGRRRERFEGPLDHPRVALSAGDDRDHRGSADARRDREEREPAGVGVVLVVGGGRAAAHDAHRPRGRNPEPGRCAAPYRQDAAERGVHAARCASVHGRSGQRAADPRDRAGLCPVPAHAGVRQPEAGTAAGAAPPDCALRVRAARCGAHPADRARGGAALGVAQRRQAEGRPGSHRAAHAAPDRHPGRGCAPADPPGGWRRTVR